MTLIQELLAPFRGGWSFTTTVKRFRWDQGRKKSETQRQILCASARVLPQALCASSLPEGAIHAPPMQTDVRPPPGGGSGKAGGGACGRQGCEKAPVLQTSPQPPRRFAGFRPFPGFAGIFKPSRLRGWTVFRRIRTRLCLLQNPRRECSRPSATVPGSPSSQTE